MSDFTDPVSETLGNALTAPTGVRAMDATDGTTAGIKVMWNAVSGADSYEIQRFGAGAGNNEWGDLVASPTAGNTTPVPTGTEFTDTEGLAANMTYLYRVRMVKEGVMSGWSTPAPGTTMATEVTDRADTGGDDDRTVHDPPLLGNGVGRDRLSPGVVGRRASCDRFRQSEYECAAHNDKRQLQKLRPHGS